MGEDRKTGEHMSGTGELSKLFGIDRTTLNYYVKKGLILAGSTDNQYHTYAFSDCMALAYIRYCRGMGFSGDEIMELLCEDGPRRQIERIEKRQEDLKKQIEQLHLRQIFLENHHETLTFIAEHTDRLTPILTEPYYFVKKSDAEKDPVWLGLYKTAPNVEFNPHFNAKARRVEMPDLFNHSGISMKESWIRQFGLTPPEGSIYYPQMEKYVISWYVSALHPEKEISEKVRELFEFRSVPKRLSPDFVLYLFPVFYQSDRSCYGAICFFETALD